MKYRTRGFLFVWRLLTWCRVGCKVRWGYCRMIGHCAGNIGMVIGDRQRRIGHRWWGMSDRRGVRYRRRAVWRVVVLIVSTGGNAQCYYRKYETYCNYSDQIHFICSWKLLFGFIHHYYRDFAIFYAYKARFFIKFILLTIYKRISGMI